MTRDDEPVEEDEQASFSDPRNPDWDLSHWAPAGLPSSEDRKPWFTQRWVLLIVAVLVITGLMLPFIVRI